MDLAPAVNPARLGFNSFADENPRGFGLLQRDRVFDHYQDDNVYYDGGPVCGSSRAARSRRLGKGAVQLVEIPTLDETFDNIVAFWNPRDAIAAGQELLFGYRLYWGSQMPFSPPLAQTIATRTGVGASSARNKNITRGISRSISRWRFGGLAKDADIEAVITTSRGEVEHPTVHLVHELNAYRALFDLKLTDDGVSPVDMRMFLRISADR